MFLCSLSAKGILSLLSSFIINPFFCQYHFYSESVWNVPGLQPLQWKCMPDLHDFYIWLSLQGAPIAVLIQRCFVVGKRGKKAHKTKTKVYFCLTTTLFSLADVRSWIYKTKAPSALQLSADRWMRINSSGSKKNTFSVGKSETFGKMATVCKWQLWVCHFVPGLVSISWAFTAALVSIMLYFCCASFSGVLLQCYLLPLFVSHLFQFISQVSSIIFFFP